MTTFMESIQNQASQSGGLKVDWGTTVSYGAMWRVEDQNPRFQARGAYSDLAIKTQINKNE